jgi:hypothetical protein
MPVVDGRVAPSACKEDEAVAPGHWRLIRGGNSGHAHGQGTADYGKPSGCHLDGGHRIPETIDAFVLLVESLRHSLGARPLGQMIKGDV